MLSYVDAECKWLHYVTLAIEIVSEKKKRNLEFISETEFEEHFFKLQP